MKKLLLTTLIWINFFFVFPCGWDSDTIEMERQQFPSIHELITGKFLRHSKEFYYWRTKDREEKIKMYPDSIALYDDLAWAYDKIGEQDKAIDIMLKKDKLSPGLYETYANLGTHHVHKGESKTGVEYIKRAIEINPEAHFGREVYQMHLVEYVIAKKDSLGNYDLPLGTQNNNFYNYLKKHEFKGSSQKEIAKAIKGIAGMMKFGHYESPVLLEVLGDLLNAADNGVDKGAGHLASRAYLKASFEVEDSIASKKYYEKASQARERNFSGRLSGRFGRANEDPNERGERLIPRASDFHGHAQRMDDLVTILKLETQAANKWFNEEIKSKELEWIKAGVNPDSAFSATFYKEPKQLYVSKNVARIKEGQIEEEYWLNKQLNNIEEISLIHNVSELDDSTKKWIDEVYIREFEVYKGLDTVKTDTTKLLSEAKSNSEEKKSNKMWLYLFGGLVFVGMFIVLISRRK